jgi:hypothetical protein
MKSVAATDFAAIVVTHPFLTLYRVNASPACTAPASSTQYFPQYWVFYPYCYMKAREKFPHSGKIAFSRRISVSFAFQDLRIHAERKKALYR